jgi:hypothetical protein
MTSIFERKAPGCTPRTVKSNSLDTLLLACFGFNKFEETHPQNGLTELIGLWPIDEINSVRQTKISETKYFPSEILCDSTLSVENTPTDRTLLASSKELASTGWHPSTEDRRQKLPLCISNTI